MPSGAKRRKAARKKKEKEIETETGLHLQALQQDSGNENGNEHEHEHEHVNSEDAITPKTQEKQEEKGEGEHGCPVEQEDNLSSTGGHPVETTDIRLAVREIGRGKENEPFGPLNYTGGGYPKQTGDGDGVVTRTDVGLRGFSCQSSGGDEIEVSSSKVIPIENKSIQTTGPFTNVYEYSPKDDTHVDTESLSQELESSDGDESKLDITSTLAVFDTNESLQSLGSVGSPRSFQSISSEKFPDQTYNDRFVLISQDRDGVSEGISETPFQDLSSESESADTPVYKVQIDTIELQQEEDKKKTSLSPEVMKGFRNEENIQIPGESVSDNYAIREEEFSESVVNCENTQGAALISSATANKQSEAIATVEGNITKTLVVPLLKKESSNMRGTPMISIGGKASGNLISTGGEASRDLISTGGEASGDLISTGGVEASGDVVSIRKSSIDLGSLGKASGDVVSPGREASGDVVSTGREASGDAVLVGRDVVSMGGESSGDVVYNGGISYVDVVSNGREAHVDVVSNGREPCGEAFSTGEESNGDNLGSSQVQDTSICSKEFSIKKLHPQNGENEKATFFQREARTSWFSCCGIFELFRGAQS